MIDLLPGKAGYSQQRDIIGVVITKWLLWFWYFPPIPPTLSKQLTQQLNLLKIQFLKTNYKRNKSTRRIVFSNNSILKVDGNNSKYDWQ